MQNDLMVPGANSIAAIAATDPSTAWLYTGGNRISIDNDHRDGFIVKGTDEKLTEICAIINSATQLNSHKQPDEKRDAPRHNDPVEWCESRDNKSTNSQGHTCGDCAAFMDCRWKIEIALTMPSREQEFSLTLPTASSMRFKSAVGDLAKKFKFHFSQVIWRMTVSIEKSNGNVFPIVNFEALDTTTGEPLSANGNGSEPAKPLPNGNANVAKNKTSDWGKRGVLISRLSQLPHYNKQPRHVLASLAKLELQGAINFSDDDDTVFVIADLHAKESARENK